MTSTTLEPVRNMPHFLQRFILAVAASRRALASPIVLAHNPMRLTHPK